MKKTVKRAKRPAKKQVLATEDRASQEKLAQVVVDTVNEMKSKTPPPSEQAQQILTYLEDVILPKAKNSSFMGMVPVIEDGVFTAKQVNSVSELEKVIADIKAGIATLAVAELPKTNLETAPVAEVQSKSEAKRLGFMGKIAGFFNK